MNRLHSWLSVGAANPGFAAGPVARLGGSSVGPIITGKSNLQIRVLLVSRVSPVMPDPGGMSITNVALQNSSFDVMFVTVARINTLSPLFNTVPLQS
jgi:hypothetical protein